MLARFRSWLRAFWQWLAEPRLFWVALLVIVLAVLVSYCPGATDVQIRLTSLVLQWLGLGTVIFGVDKTLRYFGQPSLSQSLRQWLSRFPRWLRPVTVEPGTGDVAVVGERATAEVWSNMDPAAPVQAQLNALRQNVERLNDRQRQMQVEMDRAVRRHTEELRRERESRAEGDKSLDARLEGAQTGGLHITLIGVLWLAAGVFLDHVP